MNKQHLNLAGRWLLLILAVSAICACTGAPLLPQTNPAMMLQAAPPVDLQQRVRELQSAILNDKYLSAFLYSGFHAAPPAEASAAKNAQPEEVQSNEVQATHLVTVEVWNLVIGKEKISILEKAQALGATELPAPSEWNQWQMAIGNIQNNDKKTIIFLAPPDFGKFASGDRILVEIANTGGVHTARYHGVK